MATCARCGKGWNSWGADDEFCSDNCEHEHKLEAIGLSYGVLNSLDRTQLKVLESILLTRTGIDALQDVVLRLLKS